MHTGFGKSRRRRRGWRKQQPKWADGLWSSFSKSFVPWPDFVCRSSFFARRGSEQLHRSPRSLKTRQRRNGCSSSGDSNSRRNPVEVVTAVAATTTTTTIAGAALAPKNREAGWRAFSESHQRRLVPDRSRHRCWTLLLLVTTNWHYVSL